MIPFALSCCKKNVADDTDFYYVDKRNPNQDRFEVCMSLIAIFLRRERGTARARGLCRSRLSSEKIMPTAPRSRQRSLDSRYCRTEITSISQELNLKKQFLHSQCIPGRLRILSFLNINSYGAGSCCEFAAVVRYFVAMVVRNRGYKASGCRGWRWPAGSPISTLLLQGALPQKIPTYIGRTLFRSQRVSAGPPCRSHIPSCRSQRVSAGPGEAKAARWRP